MPKNVRERKQLSLYVNSAAREQLLDAVIKRFPDARSLSDGVFFALEEWARFAEAGKALKPLLDELKAALDTAEWGLSREDDLDRYAVYESLICHVLGLLREEIGANHSKLLAKPLTKDQALLFSAEARSHGPHAESFWQEVRTRAGEDDIAQDGSNLWDLTIEQMGLATQTLRETHGASDEEEDDRQ